MTVDSHPQAEERGLHLSFPHGCQKEPAGSHLDLGLPASRTGKEYISVTQDGALCYLRKPTGTPAPSKLRPHLLRLGSSTTFSLCP